LGFPVDLDDSQPGAFLLGFLSVKGVRFALLLGGFAMSGFVILLPKAVL
jgi:hypothetical protein